MNTKPQLGRELDALLATHPGDSHCCGVKAIGQPPVDEQPAQRVFIDLTVSVEMHVEPLGGAIDEVEALHSSRTVLASKTTRIDPRACNYIRQLLGGRLFPGVHHHAHFSVEENNDCYRIALDSDDDDTHLFVEVRTTSEFKVDSIFDSLQTASNFFEAGSLGFLSPRCARPTLARVI